jgi:hypothetical protein
MKWEAFATGIGAIALLAGTSVLNPAAAALNACPASFTTDGTAKVREGATTNSAASACQYISPPDNNTIANATTVNANAFFGETDWESNGQDQLSTGGQSGTWTIANPDFATYDYAIFFKDGAGTNLVGFLFDENSTSGTWLTPFVDPPFTGVDSKDVSHYTILRNPEGTPPPPPQVPEPASLAILGGALLGMGWLVRRRQLS